MSLVEELRAEAGGHRRLRMQAADELERLQDKLATALTAVADCGEEIRTLESRLDTIRRKCEAEPRPLRMTDFEQGRVDLADAILGLMQMVVERGVSSCAGCQDRNDGKPFSWDRPHICADYLAESE